MAGKIEISQRTKELMGQAFDAMGVEVLSEMEIIGVDKCTITLDFDLKERRMQSHFLLTSESTAEIVSDKKFPNKSHFGMQE